MQDCPFCKMVAGEIKPNMVLEAPSLIAFRDINPQAPVHVLIVPRKHIGTLNDVPAEDAGLMGEMLLAAQKIAKQEGIAAPGYRLVMNCNADGGQTVFHIHMHLLGGRRISWPPG
ncbi:MAG TPA: histidine triad nucleotide-binding protein [Gammaproteobacteria bacterium]|nr:histidine triad nucleotide-binding protein [Gammaproteobacteria bacterium]